MEKKIKKYLHSLVVLVVLGMLIVTGTAAADNGSEFTDKVLSKVAEYVLEHGHLDLYVLTNRGVKMIGVYFVKEDVFLAIEDHGDGVTMFIMDVPYEEGQSLVLAEYFNDNDVLIDAVGLRWGEEDKVTAVPYHKDAIPFYSAIYWKHLKKLIDKYVDLSDAVI